MKRFLLLLPVAALAACSSAPTSESAGSGDNSMIYVSSQRPAASIASCLGSRLPNTHLSKRNDATDITVGPRSNGAYFVTLTPYHGNTVIKVVRGTASEPPEEQFRFAIARCAT